MLDDFREWLSDNLRYILLGLAVILAVVIIVCIVRLAGGRSSGSASTGQSTSSAGTAVSTTDASATAAASTESSDTASASGQDTSASSTAESLVKDDAAILSVITQYYTAVAAGDETTLSQIVEPWNDTVRDNLLSSNVMESYNDLTTYSRSGLTEGSYVVYAYYKGKISGISTEVPSLSLFYLVTDSSGKLVVSSDRESDQEVSDYVTKVTSDADVQNLIRDVNDEYKAALASDSDLASYVNSSSAGSGSSGETSTEAENTSSGSSTSSTVMTATAGLNIRQEPNTSSAVLGTVIAGTDVTVLEDMGDGWVRISYSYDGTNTIEGYVMLQYLTASSDSSGSTTDTTTSADSSSSDDSAEPAPDSADNVAA